jgi:hypothetical protein
MSSPFNVVRVLNMWMKSAVVRGQLKCDGTRAETRFRLSAKRTSPLKSAGASVQSTTGSRGVLISSSNGGYTMFRGSVKSTGYTLNSPVSPSLPHPCVIVCHHISALMWSVTVSRSDRCNQGYASQCIAGPYNRVVNIATHYGYITSTTGIFSIMLDTARETKWLIAVSSNNFPRRHVLRGANMRLIHNVRSQIQHTSTHRQKKI